MKFNIIANLVVICANLHNGKKYILSLNNNDIKLPSLELDKDKLLVLNRTLMDYLKSLNIGNDNMSILIPQIISLDSTHIESDSESINVVFGFLVDYYSNINNCYWIEFDYGIPNKYSNLIFEVVQKLQ